MHRRRTSKRNHWMRSPPLFNLLPPRHHLLAASTVFVRIKNSGTFSRCPLFLLFLLMNYQSQAVHLILYSSSPINNLSRSQGFNFSSSASRFFSSYTSSRRA